MTCGRMPRRSSLTWFRGGESAFNIEAYQKAANEMLAEKNIKPLFVPQNLLDGATRNKPKQSMKGNLP